MKVILQRRTFFKVLKKQHSKGKITTDEYIYLLKAELDNLPRQQIISSS